MGLELVRGVVESIGEDEAAFSILRLIPEPSARQTPERGLRKSRNGMHSVIDLDGYSVGSNDNVSRLSRRAVNRCRAARRFDQLALVAFPLGMFSVSAQQSTRLIGIYFIRST